MTHYLDLKEFLDWCEGNLPPDILYQIRAALALYAAATK